MALAVPATKPNRILAVLCAACILSAIMLTLITPLVGQLPRLLNTTTSNAAWVVTATLLSSAVSTPIAGRLGDICGKRRVLLICLVPIAVGSVVCALSASVVPMIVGRGLQGMGLGVIPLSISILRDVLPDDRLGFGIASASAAMGVGVALGLPISAAVAEYGSWHYMFWGAGVLTAVVAVIVAIGVPADGGQGTKHGFDLVGALGLGGAVVCLLLGISKGPSWGWNSGAVLGLFAATVALLVLWGLWELRCSDPIVDLRVTRKPPVLLTNVAGILLGFAMYVQLLVVPQILQLPASTGYGLEQSLLSVGILLAPAGLMTLAMSPIVPRMSAAYSPKTTLVTGSLILAAGYASYLALSDSILGLLMVTSLCGAGSGLAYGVLGALIMEAVPRSQTAAATSLNTLMRTAGSAIASASTAVLLSEMVVQFGGQDLPSENGFRTAMLVGCAGALAAAAVAAAIPSGRRKSTATVTGSKSSDELVSARV
ncbi:MFS transporter [Nocardia sp. bgisy134]|uniref:MFS transporter n=1 Tax=Nocardia sp. bgisy134 TaxID=3413789 RepID=UPI003D70659F